MLLGKAPVRIALAMAAAGWATGPVPMAFGQGAAKPLNLAPHVAIYDLKLTNSRGKRALESLHAASSMIFRQPLRGDALQFSK